MLILSYQCAVHWRLMRDRPLLVSVHWSFFRDRFTNLSEFNRYSVPNATGKEVAILDLYPDTGALGSVLCSSSASKSHLLILATNILVKDVFSTTETGAPVAVMCDPTTVSIVLILLFLLDSPLIDNSIQITTDVGFKCWDGRFIPTKAGLWLRDTPLGLGQRECSDNCPIAIRIPIMFIGAWICNIYKRVVIIMSHIERRNGAIIKRDRIQVCTRPTGPSRKT